MDLRFGAITVTTREHHRSSSRARGISSREMTRERTVTSKCGFNDRIRPNEATFVPWFGGYGNTGLMRSTLGRARPFNDSPLAVTSRALRHEIEVNGFHLRHVPIEREAAARIADARSRRAPVSDAASPRRRSIAARSAARRPAGREAPPRRPAPLRELRRRASPRQGASTPSPRGSRRASPP